MEDGHILPIEKGFEYQHLVLAYLMLTRHPRIAWKYEDIDDVMSVDYRLISDQIDIYTVKSSNLNFNIKSLFCGKRSILKPFLRSYAKIVNKSAKPRLFLVTNRKIDKDASQLFFKMERLRQGNLTIDSFRNKEGSDENLFHTELKKMLTKSDKKYGLNISKGEFLRTIQRPIVVDEDEAKLTICDKLISVGKINPDEAEDKLTILLSSVAKEKVCSHEWVDSILGTRLMENIAPISREVTKTPDVPIIELKQKKLKTSITDTNELMEVNEILRQLELHLKSGKLKLSSSSMYAIMETLKRAKTNMQRAQEGADNTDGNYANVKRDIKNILDSLEG